MRPVFRALSVVAAVFGISGMAYYYHSIPTRPASLTAQVAESAEAVTANTAPLWQSVYSEYYKGHDDFGLKVLPAWGWPNPLGRSSNQPYDYHAFVSYFDAFPTNNPAQNVIVRDVVFPNDKDEPGHEQTTRGSIMAAPGSEITLEWACQPAQYQALPTNACGIALCRAEYYFYKPVGSFVEDESQWLGRATVTLGNADTTYTLTCKRRAGYLATTFKWGWGGWQTVWAGGTPPTDAVMKIPVKVCPRAPRTAAGAYKLESGQIQNVNVTVEEKTYNYCINNPTSLDYLVPAGSIAEMDAFIRAIRNGDLKEGAKVVEIVS